MTPRDSPFVRRIASAAAAVAACGLILLVAGNRRSDTYRSVAGDRAADPEDVVETLVDAELAGDVDGVLACLTGAAQSEFESRLAAASPDGVGRDLKSRAQALKARAILDVNRPDQETTSLILERVYSDRIERQRIELRLERSEWKAERIVDLDRFAPSIQYGTPIAPSGGE